MLMGQACSPQREVCAVGRVTEAPVPRLSFLWRGCRHGGRVQARLERVGPNTAVGEHGREHVGPLRRRRL